MYFGGIGSPSCHPYHEKAFSFPSLPFPHLPNPRLSLVALSNKVVFSRCLCYNVEDGERGKESRTDDKSARTFRTQILKVDEDRGVSNHSADASGAQFGVQSKPINPSGDWRDKRVCLIVHAKNSNSHRPCAKRNVILYSESGRSDRNEIREILLCVEL